jgi:hypothetical protein
VRSLPVRSGLRDAERLGGLLGGEAAEEAQLDQARLAVVERGELIQSRIEVEQIWLGGADAPWPASSVIRNLPPRLAEARERAWSTRTRRIKQDAMAKNCSRFRATAILQAPPGR